jgi:hypothetical protein
VVDALLRAAGHDVEWSGSVALAGDVALYVADVPFATLTPAELLDQGYLALAHVDRSRRVVLTPGMLDGRDVRRREGLDPHVGHVGLQSIQAMADAVSDGRDPLDALVPARDAPPPR